jgi:hypothetical protein
VDDGNRSNYCNVTFEKTPKKMDNVKNNNEAYYNTSSSGTFTVNHHVNLSFF